MSVPARATSWLLRRASPGSGRTAPAPWGNSRLRDPLRPCVAGRQPVRPRRRYPARHPTAPAEGCHAAAPRSGGVGWKERRRRPPRSGRVRFVTRRRVRAARRGSPDPRPRGVAGRGRRRRGRNDGPSTARSPSPARRPCPCSARCGGRGTASGLWRGAGTGGVTGAGLQAHDRAAMHGRRRCPCRGHGGIQPGSRLHVIRRVPVSIPRTGGLTLLVPLRMVLHRRRRSVAHALNALPARRMAPIISRGVERVNPRAGRRRGSRSCPIGHQHSRRSAVASGPSAQARQRFASRGWPAALKSGGAPRPRPPPRR